MDNLTFSKGDIRTDFKHSQLLDVLLSLDLERSKTGKDVEKCDFCEKNSSSLWCVTCRMAACRTCSKAHKKSVTSHQPLDGEKVRHDISEQISDIESQVMETNSKIQTFEDDERMRLEKYKTQLDRNMHVYIDKIRSVFREIQDEIRAKIADTENRRKVELVKANCEWANAGLANLRSVSGVSIKETLTKLESFKADVESRLSTEFSCDNLLYEFTFCPPESLENIVK